MTIRIQDIAAEAGVSVATVSRVLNSSGPVGSSVRQRVLETATRLGYSPNVIARSLRTNRTNTLGLVVPDIGNPYFAETFRGFQDAATGLGYTVFAANSDGDPARENVELTALHERRVDGVVLVSASTDSGTSPSLANLLSSHTPVVAMDRALHHPDIARVLVDTRGGARAAVAHLVERGRRRIAFIAGPAHVWTAEEKLMGYYEGLAAAGLPTNPRLVLPGDYTIQSGEERAAELLEQDPVPDAVMIANNLMTLGVYRILLRRDVAIPREIAVVGYDDVPWTDVVRPTLTVVAQPTHELGRRAVEMLVSQITGSVAGRAPTLILPTSLVIREST